MADPVRAPSLLDILRGYEWHERAARRTDPNPEAFFPDRTNERNHPFSASVVLALLVCDGCPVRRPCLEESLRTWDFVYGQRPLVAWGRSPRDWGSAFGMVDASEGVWGGTTERERAEVAHLPASEAIDRLEELRAARLAERIRGYLNGPRSPRRGLLPSERRVDQMLAERGEVPDRAR